MREANANAVRHRLTSWSPMDPVRLMRQAITTVDSATPPMANIRIYGNCGRSPVV